MGGLALSILHAHLNSASCPIRWRYWCSSFGYKGVHSGLSGVGQAVPAVLFCPSWPQYWSRPCLSQSGKFWKNNFSSIVAFYQGALVPLTGRSSDVNCLCHHSLRLRQRTGQTWARLARAAQPDHVIHSTKNQTIPWTIPGTYIWEYEFSYFFLCSGDGKPECVCIFGSLKASNINAFHFFFRWCWGHSCFNSVLLQCALLFFAIFLWLSSIRNADSTWGPSELSQYPLKSWNRHS